jgi:hypothetical protein
MPRYTVTVVMEKRVTLEVEAKNESQAENEAIFLLEGKHFDFKMWAEEIEEHDEEYGEVDSISGKTRKQLYVDGGLDHG